MPLEDPNPRTPDDDSLIKGGNWLSKRIENYIARVTPACTEMTHLLSEEMDHPLPWSTRFKMRSSFSDVLLLPEVQGRSALPQRSFSLVGIERRGFIFRAIDTGSKSAP